MLIFVNFNIPFLMYTLCKTGTGLQKCEQETTKVVSLVKMAENPLSVQMVMCKLLFIQQKLISNTDIIDSKNYIM